MPVHLPDLLQGRRFLGGGGPAGQGGQVDLLHLALQVAAHGVDDPAREVAGALAGQLAVPELQRLRGDHRLGALDAVGVELGCVEGVQHGQGGGAPLQHVDAAPAAGRGALAGDLAVLLDLDLIRRSEGSGIQPA